MFNILIELREDFITSNVKTNTHGTQISHKQVPHSNIQNFVVVMVTFS